jgi:transposase
MRRYRATYPPEFRRQMVELVRSGRTPEELARVFEPTVQSVDLDLVKQAERDAGKRTDGPSSGEQDELARLRRVNHRLARSVIPWERLQPGSRRWARQLRTGLPVHERASGPRIPAQ